MQRNLTQLADKEYDLVVVGGGITGACIAHDAALRGISTALVERDDFGSFTSSASSKLLHGGIRYLPKGQVWKVRESGKEQAIFQMLAPHLTRWVPFLIPTETNTLSKGKLALQTAMYIYQLCHAGLRDYIKDESKFPPRAQYFSKQKVIEMVPLLKAFHSINGAQVLYESHMHSSERMTLSFLKTAVQNGADLANHLEVENYLFRKGKVAGVCVKDRLTGEKFDIQSKLTVNAAGPTAQMVNQSVPLLRLHHKINGVAKGVHLVTKQIHSDYALALTTKSKTEGLITRGGRHFFIIPWRGHSLIGTSNVPYKGNLYDVSVTNQDVRDFLDDINESLPGLSLTFDDVLYSYSGLYPIISKKIKQDTYQGTGKYQLVDHEKTDRVPGILTSLGAKYTTGRYLAEKTVDLVCKKLHLSERKCTTDRVPLAEGRIENLNVFIADKKNEYKSLLSKKKVENLVKNHGNEIDRIVNLAVKDKALLSSITPKSDTIFAEVLYAIRHEMALTLDDVLFQRTGIGTVGYPGDEITDAILVYMAEELKWDEKRCRNERSKLKSRYGYFNG